LTTTVLGRAIFRIIRWFIHRLQIWMVKNSWRMRGGNGGYW
jgi:hypothetical protein